MIPVVRAKQLEDQAKVLRSMAAGMLLSGQPIELVVNGESRPLHQITGQMLLNDAEMAEREAEKLRSIYQ